MHDWTADTRGDKNRDPEETPTENIPRSRMPLRYRYTAKPVTGASWSAAQIPRNLSEQQRYQPDHGETWLSGRLPTDESILVVVDYYSRYYEVDILRSTVSSMIISSLEEMFARRGLPESLKSDNGPQFIAAEFAEYMAQQGIRQHRVTAKWAQANGEVEGQNSLLLKRLQIANTKKKNWRRELTTYLAAYRIRANYDIKGIVIDHEETKLLQYNGDDVVAATRLQSSA